ncbi:MAG: hypothetical protein RLZZ341_1088 [Pseudomonadota bacterium]
MNANRRRILAACSIPLLAPLPARSTDRPASAVVLTIRGKVSRPNDGTAAQFDMPMLERLPQRSLTTRTPWYDGPRTFTGPLLRDVLEAAGADGTTIRAIALNDYKVDIPLADARRFDVVMARLINGQAIPVRDKGPLFIIYPFDDRAELRVPQYFSRCAWQLRTLEIL